MKVKDVIKLMKKQNPENELIFNSVIESSGRNVPVNEIYENRIIYYKFSDGKTYSYIPDQYIGKDVEISLTDELVSVLTDSIS